METRTINDSWEDCKIELKKLDNPNFRETTDEIINHWIYKNKQHLNYNVMNHFTYTFNFFKDLNIDSEDKTFVDIGCQTDILKNIVKSKWIGQDIFPHPEFDTCDIHTLIYEDNSHDIIFCSHTLEHTFSPLIALMEMKRVMKKDGDLILGVPVYPGFMCEEHFYILPVKSWELLITRAGLKIEKVSEVKEDCVCFHLKK